MPASLMVGFIATARSRQIIMRDHELEDARWFTPQQIIDGIADGSFVPSTALSVSYQLLAYWLQQRCRSLILNDLAAGNASMTPRCEVTTAGVARRTGLWAAS